MSKCKVILDRISEYMDPETKSLELRRQGRNRFMEYYHYVEDSLSLLVLNGIGDEKQIAQEALDAIKPVFKTLIEEYFGYGKDADGNPVFDPMYKENDIV